MKEEIMRKPFRVLAALLVCCMVAGMLPPASSAAEGSVLTPTEDQKKSFAAYVDSPAVKDGDIIDLGGGTAHVGGGATDEPWIITKAVTIQNGSIVIRRGGVLLGADVTFSNITANFTSNIRNAMIANGHTLTLENVTAAGSPVEGVQSQNMSFNLFCGTLYPSDGTCGATESFSVPTPGAAGKIVIKGSTKLQNENIYGPGNIYAGSLCMGGLDQAHNGANQNGPKNEFQGDAEIVIEGAASSTALGTVYACGAQQRIPVGAASGKNMYPDPQNYTVSGTVTVSGKVPDVAGAGSGSTKVVYRGSSNEAAPLWTSLSSLTVESGNVVLKAGSNLREDADLTVAGGAILSIVNLDTPVTVNNFTGGGSLALGDAKQLQISGSVTGTTSVGIGGVFNGASSAVPLEGHTYIQADASTDDSFKLLPFTTRPDLLMERDEIGNWTIVRNEEDVDRPILRSLTMDSISIPLNALDEPDYGAEMRLTTTFVDPKNAPLIKTFPLSIDVNGEKAKADEEWSYTASGIQEMYLDYDGADEYLWVVPEKKDARYEITITIPGEHTENGQPLSATGTLTVGNPGLTSISKPQAITGLTWTGEVQTGVPEGIGYTLKGHTGTDVGDYEATAELKAGYQWEDGTKDSVKIPWSIGKAEGPELPAGVYGIAPTTENGSDGKITGTTADMEYDTDEAFTDPKPCADGETTGLAAGTYYVRLKETKNHEAGKAAEITVPAYGTPTVESISVNSTAHKTQYKVGDALDVTGLTIEVRTSDGKSTTLLVTENMVSGFDASAAAEQQTLTIHYQGMTATYTISITAQTPEDPAYPVTVANSYAAVSGAGEYKAGETVTVRAGTRISYRFSTWQAQGITLSSPGSSEVTFTMPDHAVTLTAVWRQSSSGGSGGGSSGSGGSSSGSGSSSSSGSTVKRPDGSTVTTSTDRTTGTVTQTTKRPDGTQTVIETAKDGVVTTTDTRVDGSTVRTVDRPDGSGRVDAEYVNGISTSLVTDASGHRETEVRLPAEMTGGLQSTGGAAVLPIPDITPDGTDAVTVYTNSAQPVKVVFPAQRADSGTVAVLVAADGTRSILPACVPVAGGITVSVSDGAVVALVDNGKSFPDTGSHWAGDAITFVSARELFSGTESGSFAPDAPLSRAMLMTVLARLDGADTRSGAVWYEAGMHWAVSHGVSDGTNPEGLITREQLAVMLYRYAQSPTPALQALSFPDAAQVSGYAGDAMCWAVEQGILTGGSSGQLDPGGEATRAEAAAMLMRYLNALNR